jgi:hypothetical protein
MKARDWVALILASTAGLSVLLLTAASLYDALADPEQAGITEAYASLLTGTLGVLIGALAGYIGGTRHVGEPDPTVGTNMPAESPASNRPGETPPTTARHLSDSDNDEGNRP